MKPSKEEIKLIEMQRPHQGKWAAYNEEGTKIIASSEKLSLLEKSLKHQKVEKYVISKILPFDTVYIS